MKIDPNDFRITAYALGELDESQRRAFEEELAADPEAQAMVEETRETARILAEELREAAAPELQQHQRAAVEARIGEISAKQNVVHFRIPLFGKRSRLAIAANLAALILVVSGIAILLIWPLMTADEPEPKAADGKLQSPGAVPTLTAPPAAGKSAEEGSALKARLYEAEAEKRKREEPIRAPGDLSSLAYIAEGDASTDLTEWQFTGEPLDTEAYDRVEENPFLAVAQHPLSTFSVDVDTASYSNVRRFLNEGGLPPKDAVRIEEMVNYFNYDYPEPKGKEPFAVAVDVASAPWARSHRLARIGLKGREMPLAHRPVSNLVFLVDVSGSMDDPYKLPLLKRAMGLLIDSLGEKDHVAIVGYAGGAGLVLPSTSCADREKIRCALEQLQAGGCTCGSAGIQLAYKIASQNLVRGGTNRVILATDGDFNVGITNQGELTRLIESEAKRGIFLSVLGFGMGNYKDSTLEKLADRGNGNYAYIDTLSEARKVLIEQLSGTLVTIAKDVKIQVEFNPREVAFYRLIGYENRMLRAEDFNDDRKDAGEIGAGHTVTALYELVPPGVDFKAPRVDPLRYQKPKDLAGAAGGGELLTVKLRYKEPEGSASKLLEYQVRDQGMRFEQAGDDFRFAAAVAGFGMVLRDSEHKGTATLDRVLSWASDSAGDDPEGYRAGFIDLVRTAKALT
ncbi:MAG: von Willebrand factor type A domain-containing protein [Acidobacteriota bacterium]